MKKLLVLFITLSSLTACKQSTSSKVDAKTDNSVDRNSFAFSCPADWKVTDDEGSIADGYHYLAVEKKGFDSSGLVTISSFNDIVELDDIININIEELFSNSLFDNFNANPITDSSFNTMTSRSSTFNFSALGVKHEGTIYAFSSEDKTYAIILQGAVEDKASNQEGFEKIENSFSTK
ncbi:hypothetical protein [Winogradskyella sp. 3972H.M.0a.05]|uniref:hypothetical protein n=1 Tax=Winogradskyella sp. 3972H.M.0a.05 TaxID=2950277 RepID=UPI003397F422